jgi:anti-anti-sigma factor
MTQPPVRGPSDGGSDHDGLALVVTGDIACTRVLVVGELDCATAPRLARFLGDLLEAGHRRTDLDLSRLTFLAAAGLTVFCEATARFTGAGGRLRLTGVTPRTGRILGITGLDTVLGVESIPATPRPAGVGTAPARRPVGGHPVTVGGIRRDEVSSDPHR